MNNPNPFIPQGSLLDQKNKKRARVKVAVFSIFAMNLLVVTPLLIQGCSKKEAATDNQPPPPLTDTNVPDTNVATQLPAAPSNTVTTTSAAPVYTPPPQPAPPPVAEVPSTKDYTVVKGDSYYLIAKKYGVKMKELEAANPNVPATKLKVGMKIQIPASATGAAMTGGSAATPGMSDASETMYVVKPGDTLTKIAKSNGVSLRALRAENDLKTDKIKVGQKLKVPGKAPAPEVAPAPQPVTTSNPVPQPTQPLPGNNGAAPGR